MEDRITRDVLGYKGKCPRTCSFCTHLDACEIVTDLDAPDATCKDWEKEEPIWGEGYGAASVDQGERMNIYPPRYNKSKWPDDSDDDEYNDGGGE